MIWFTGDVVYMDSEEKLAEYVLAQDGIIFRGDAEYPVPLAWYFGQVPTYKQTPGYTCSPSRCARYAELSVISVKSVSFQYHYSTIIEFIHILHEFYLYIFCLDLNYILMFCISDLV